MKRSAPWLALLLAGVTFPLSAEPADPNACTSWHKEVRYGAGGYDHLVHLHNQCEKSVVCHVTTNSNPDGRAASLAPDEKKELVMFLGSPAREFTAQVQCR